MKMCVEYVDKNLGLNKVPRAIVWVDNQHDGAWTSHIDELGYLVSTNKFDDDMIYRNQVCALHYHKLKEFIGMYKARHSTKQSSFEVQA